jgi:hypothetical protein
LLLGEDDVACVGGDVVCRVVSAEQEKLGKRIGVHHTENVTSRVGIRGEQGRFVDRLAIEHHHVQFQVHSLQREWATIV